MSFIESLEDELKEIRGLFHHRLEIVLLLTRIDYLEVCGSLFIQELEEFQQKILQKQQSIMLLICELKQHLRLDEMSCAKQQIYQEKIEELNLYNTNLAEFHFELETKKCLVGTVFEDVRSRMKSKD